MRKDLGLLGKTWGNFWSGDCKRHWEISNFCSEPALIRSDLCQMLFVGCWELPGHTSHRNEAYEYRLHHTRESPANRSASTRDDHVFERESFRDRFLLRASG